jgi:hypothetical protein
LRSFITPAAAHLHGLIGNSPGRFCGPHFAHCRFDAQIAGLAIEQRRTEKRHSFHREHVACHLGDFSSDGGMLTDGHTPLNALRGPLARNLEQSFGNAHARGGKSEPSGVQRRQGDF